MEDFQIGDGDAIQEKEWMKTKKFILGTVDNIDEIMDHCINSYRYALDVETTGLDNRVLDHGGVLKTVDRLVGVCLSPDGITGYYIPLNHVEVKINNTQVRYPSNVPWGVFEKAFRRLITATEEKQTAAVFHNGKFDHEFLNYWGGEPFGTWDKTYMWDDTLILAYLSDSRRRQKGLKALSKQLLGIEMLELKELLPDEKDAKGRVRVTDKDFSLLDPEEPSTLWYGGGDGICTRLLYDILAPDILKPAHGFDQVTVYKIEKQCVAATRWMERNRIHLDKEKLGELIQVGHKEWYTSIMDVYAEAQAILNRDIMPGCYKNLQESFIADNPHLSIKEQLKVATGKAKQEYPDPVTQVIDATGKKWPPIYDVNAAKQLGNMFEDMGVQGLKRTEKSGQIKTSKDELDRIIEEAGKQFPFMSKIKRFREINKALSTYLYPMFNDSDPLDDTIRVNFQGHKVDTGRFSTPTKEISSKSANYMVGWPAINMQALPRSGGTQRPECMQRLRECITVRRPDRVIVAIDYSGVELRLVTNLSREPLWLSEFFHCAGCDRTFDHGDGTCTPEPPPARCPNCGSDKIGDLHTLTGISVYGKEIQANPDWKEYRGKAKCIHPDSIISVSSGLSGTVPRRIGFFPIGDINTFRKVNSKWKVWNGHKEIPITETYNGGIKKLYHIITRRGILTCSNKHRIETVDGTLKSITTGLSKGVLLSEPSKPLTMPSTSWKSVKVKPLKDFPEMNINTNCHIAYLAGAFSGDGSKAGTNSVSLCHGDISKTDKMGISYKEWQNILVGVCKDAGFSPKPKKQSIYIDSRHVMRIFTSLGLINPTDNDSGKRSLRIPDWVLGNGRKAIMWFLGGLFDTDGTVGKRDGILSVTTKDAVFAGQIASVLQFVGVLPYCEASWNKTYSKWYYRIKVSGSQAPYFKPYLKHPGKIRRIHNRKTGTSLPNKVMHIIPAEEMPCMDLHVESDDHLYWTSGVISHNSLNFALCYGGSGLAAQRAAGVDRNEGNRLKRQFDGTYRTLKNWWDSQHAFARQQGFVVTAFRRRYPLPDINHADNGFRSKAERNAINGPIQGCLHPDCQVPTKQGLQKVKDLWDAEKSFEVWTGKKWEHARPLFSGKKAVQKTFFNDGNSILTSPEHLFYVWRGDSFQWVPQGDLINGDWVAADPLRPHTGREMVFPYNIVTSIGKILKKYSISSGSTKQIAVLRLVAGLGSKSQCLRLLEFYGNPELPLEIQDALTYDWCFVTDKKDLNQTINMYDVEVLDNLHAFSCDGLIVHNTSADITKIAMGLVYNECNKRGWLDKVQMIITMHDELVFEIDLDVLEEAIAVINPIMCRNPMILSQKWPIPLTTDVEIGVNWTVPWDINAIKYKEIRFIGDKKFYKPKDIPENYNWDDMETWPDTLRPFFNPESDPVVTQPIPDGAVQQKIDIVLEPENPVKAVPVTPVTPVAPVIDINPKNLEPPKTTIPSGSVFKYQLHKPLTLGTLFQLAHVINLCKNKGTRILHVLTVDGKVLAMEKEYGTILINPSTFGTLANEHIT